MCVVPKVWHQEEVLDQAAILKHSIVLLEIPSPDHTEEGPQSWGSPPQHLIQPAAVWHHRTTSSSIGPSKKRVPCSTMVPFSWSVHLVLDLLIMSVTLEVIKCNFSLLPSFQCPHLVCSGGPMAQFSGVGRNAAFEDFFFSFKAFLSVLPDGYWAAVSTSNGLNLGRGSSSILTDSPSGPPAQCRCSFWFYPWTFLFHPGSLKLLKMSIWLRLTSAAMARCAKPCFSQQSNRLQTQEASLLVPSGGVTNRNWHRIQIFGQILPFVTCLASICCFCTLDLERSLDPRVQNANLQFFYWS